MALVDLPEDAEIIPLGKLSDLPAGAEVQGAYSGSVLPLSRDAQGNVKFDLNAGFLGRLIEALRAPGDVYTGKAPIMMPGAPGGYNPDLIKRGADFAAFFTPINPAIRAGDLPIPGEALASMSPQRVAPPTAQELKKVGGAGYDAARASGLEVAPQVVIDTATQLQSALTQKGMGAGNAPKTHALLDEWSGVQSATADRAQGILRRLVTPDDLEALRRNLSGVSGESTDQAAARAAIREIDRIFERLAPQDVLAGPATAEALQSIANTQRDARQNYASAMRSNDITGALDRAVTGVGERALNRAQAANSGYNIDNAIRQKLRAFLEKPENVAGYSDAELQALRDALQGSFARNAARDVGNRMGTGATATALGLLSGSTAGAATQNPYIGAAAALAPAIAGAGLKSVANKLAQRSLGAADDVIRSNSPLYREMLANSPLMNPAAGRDAAILRAILLGGSQGQVPFGFGPVI